MIERKTAHANVMVYLLATCFKSAANAVPFEHRNESDERTHLHDYY